MLPVPSANLSSLPALQSVDWTKWRQAAAIPERTPFLLSPTFEYDVDLNGFFLSGEMLGRAWNTQNGYARDLKAFLSFLWRNRNRSTWRDVTADDHLAYLVWRRTDPDGPRIDDSTWDRGSHGGQPVLRLAGAGTARSRQPNSAAGATTSITRCRA